MRAPLYSDLDDELLRTEAINNPHSIYQRLRETQPLSRLGDSGVHLVANWDLVHEVLQREQDFSANLRGVLFRGADDKPAVFELPASVSTMVIATADEPRHSIHRNLIQPHFTPSAVARLEPSIEAWVTAELTPLCAALGGDFIGLSERVPALVVARLLGLPEQDLEHFRVWAMMGGDMLAGEVSGQRLGFLATETTKMAEYLGTHFDLAYASVSDINVESDSIMQVLARGVKQQLIDREEAIGIAIVLFGAGGESTAALIASCVKMLAERSELVDQLRADPNLVLRFVEEVVRLEAPFKFHYRAVNHSCDLAGHELNAGDSLMLLWAAANRDPQHVENPDELRLDRKHPKQHTGFGRGLHFCVGAVLARLEAKVVVQQLLATGVNFRLADEGAVYANSIFVRRLEKLEIDFTPNT